MKPMLAAIKSKRMSYGEEEESAPEAGQGKDLKAIVDCLDDGEKAQLMALLEGKDRSLEIQKGEASTEEQGKIDQAIASEDKQNAMQGEEDESRFSEADQDDGMRGMVDRQDMQADPSRKPKNLGERLRMHAAQNLKGKGKL